MQKMETTIHAIVSVGNGQQSEIPHQLRSAVELVSESSLRSICSHLAWCFAKATTDHNKPIDPDEEFSFPFPVDESKFSQRLRKLVNEDLTFSSLFSIHDGWFNFHSDIAEEERHALIVFAKQHLQLRLHYYSRTPER
ncbi:MAG: hypothetical protein N2C14_09965 [Planctomycetales bacterium]